MQINIETEHLILRNMRLSDVSQDYADWLNDPEVNRHLSCAEIHQTIESCTNYVRSYENRNDRALIGIYLKGNGLHIGNLTLSTIDWKDKTGTVGICIGRKGYTGKGLGKEALGAAVQYCFNQLGLDRLQAYLNVENTKSLNLFKGCRFRIEGVLKGRGMVNGKPSDDCLVAISNRGKKTSADR